MGALKEVPGFEVGRLLYEGARSVVFRAKRHGDGRRVVLKCLRDPNPTPADLARLERERTLTQSLAGENVIAALGLVRERQVHALVLDDTGGESLDRCFPPGPDRLPDAAEILQLGIAVARALAHIHRRGAIHKDVTPANIVYCKATGAVHVIDFGLATALQSEDVDPGSPELLEGTLPYMAPEQTGRMNRSVDHRADLYGLGTTLFRIAVGTPPFEGTGALELAHAHLAVPPPILANLRPDLPLSLSDIVARLLAKDPADRYQSSEGALHDLEETLERWRTGVPDRMGRFPLAKKDSRARFSLPEKLYGREPLLDGFSAAFHRAATGRVEVVHLVGPAGSGKSALLREALHRITPERAYFGAGKFEQIASAAPYMGIAQALRAVLRQVMRESEADIAARKQALSQAVGANGGVLTQALPEVTWLLGPQAVPEDLPPSEAQNRFQLTLLAFMGALARPDHPLVVALDDVQWADGASLAAWSHLAEDPTLRHVLLVAASREEEIGAGHPAQLAIDAAAREHGRVTTLRLSPLTLADVHAFVGDALGDAEAPELAKLCHEKTHGSPFFLGQLLLSMRREGVISFDRSLGRWTVALDAAALQSVTDNVGELLSRGLSKLPADTQQTLRTAALLGGRFPLSLLSAVEEKPKTTIAGDLWPALEQGLVVPEGGYNLVTDTDGCEVFYRFAHDRIQWAAAASVDPAGSAALRLRIGKTMMAALEQGTSDDPARRFEAVEHWNAGAALEPDKYKLARTNLDVGRAALRSAAHVPALAMFEAGARALCDVDGRGAPDRAFREEYPLALALFHLAAETAELTSQLGKMTAFANVVLANARSLLDRVPTEEVLIRAELNRGRPIRAVELGVRVLAGLGVDLPLAPSKARLLASLARTKWMMRRFPPESLVRLPPMKDPRAMAAVRLLMKISSAVYLSAKDTLPFLVFELVRVSVEHGCAPESAYSFSGYAFMLCGVLGDYDLGARFAEAALALSERPEARHVRAKLLFHATFASLHWKVPYQKTLPHLLDGYRVGLDTGDMEYAFWSGLQHTLHGLIAGAPLGEHRALSQGILRIMRRTHAHAAAIRMQLLLRVMACFADGPSAGPEAEGGNRGAHDPISLTGEGFDEPEVLATFVRDKDPNGQAWYHAQKLFVSVLWGRFEAAERHAEAATALQESMMATLQIPLVTWLGAITALERRGAQGLKAAQRARKQIAKWAKHAPENHTARLALLDAEIARVSGELGAAREAFDRAIHAAEAAGRVHEAALAAERAAQLHLRAGRGEHAAVYLREAHGAYVRWGAAAKATALAAAHPVALVRSEAPAASAQMTSTRTKLTLEWLALVQASQSISGEIRTDDLLRRLMTTLVEVSGADRAVLRLAGDPPRHVGWERGVVTTSYAAPPPLPETLLRYVERTGEAQVLDDVARSSLFRDDPHFAADPPRSALCLAVKRQSSHLGVLYLENRLTTDAFTPSRCQLLEVLSTQAAISIENAQLYDTLENRVRDRTRDLTDALQRLRDAQHQLVLHEKLASLGMLTSGIAHEIRNPLNFIKNFAELSEGLAEEVAEGALTLTGDHADDVRDAAGMLKANLTKIREHGARAEDILRAMLAHARERRGGRERTDLNALVEQYARLGRHPPRELGSAVVPRLVTQLDPEVGALVIVPEDIGRVVLNLVGNAVYAAVEKHTKTAETEPPEVVVATRAQGDKAVIVVRDNGVGIPAAVSARVMEPFFTTKPPGQGTGLGLSIAYDIVVQGHQGTLDIESQEGQYTEVRVTLPRS